MNHISRLSIFTAVALLLATSSVAAESADKHSGTHASKTVHTPTAADNTGKNVRDRRDQAITADSQSNDQGDLDTVAKVRSGLVDHDGLSTSAKNIKIIIPENSKQLLLRGPVTSAKEKSEVEALVRKLAAPMQVHSELEVAAH